METGKIKWFNEQKGYGFIERERAKDIFIHKSEWKVTGVPQEEQKVSFEVSQGRKGLEAKNVRPVEQAGQKHQRLPDEPYRFLNPYNFVRYLDKPRKEDYVLGNCSPPPHDRYVGLTGRIECEIEAVTPLFVSDSHAVQEGNDKHKSYRFFQYDGQPALPASSLRGMVRSVFEAATNSCLGVFEGGGYDLRKGQLPDKLVPARVIEVDNKGAKLEMLDCSLNPPPNAKKRKSGKKLPLMKAATIQSYVPQVKDTKSQKTFDSGKNKIPAKIKSSDRVAALVNLTRADKGVYEYYQVEQVVPLEQQTTLRLKPGTQKIFGYIHITGPNIEKKNAERIFFRWDDKLPQQPVWESIPDRYRKKVDPDTLKEYEEHLKNYWERHSRQIEALGRKPWPKDKLPHPSDFVQENGKLREGDLVYYISSDSRDNKKTFPVLRPILISRLPYKYNRLELLKRQDSHLLICQSYETLCPACRTFGWVAKEKTDGQQAYAGRIRFSHGKLKELKGTLPDTPLAILSSPKPTTTSFYLLKNSQTDGNVDYNSPNAQLRGRKVYRHHGNQLREKEYTRAPNGDQNRTVRGALKPGAKFTFTIDFENLAEVELGALLWALELDEGMYHRLGYAKPLGFGSVKLKVTEAKRLHPEERYTSLETWNDGWQPIEQPQIDKWKQTFKQTMITVYKSGHDFYDLEPVKDLRCLFSKPSELPIHYPRSAREPTSEEKNFEWFMGNKKEHRREPLPLPCDDTDGFPIWDRDGKEIP